MTSANARHHLHALEGQDLIEVIGQRPPKGRGRPTKLYGLAHKAMESNLENLATALLKALQESDKTAEREFAKLIPHLFEGVEPEANFIQKISAMTKQLTEMNYQARWEASSEGPKVILGHCPYAAILEENPELCQMDRVLISERLGLPVEQTAKLERGPQGTPHCVFAVRGS